MKRTNASTRIIDAATEHFAKFGYDGSALSGIAEVVGIKKASLYAHFTNKDALFMETYKDAVAAERASAEQCFNLENDADLPGFKYCSELVERFGKSRHLQFFLRTSYSPPKHLDEEIDVLHEAYLEQLRLAFKDSLTRSVQISDKFPNQLKETLEVAYLGIVDSVQVKLIYTTKELSKIRLQALFKVFGDSIISNQNVSST